MLPLIQQPYLRGATGDEPCDIRASQCGPASNHHPFRGKSDHKLFGWVNWCELELQPRSQHVVSSLASDRLPFIATRLISSHQTTKKTPRKSWETEERKANHHTSQSIGGKRIFEWSFWGVKICQQLAETLRALTPITKANTGLWYYASGMLLNNSCYQWIGKTWKTWRVLLESPILNGKEDLWFPVLIFPSTTPSMQTNLIQVDEKGLRTPPWVPRG